MWQQWRAQKGQKGKRTTCSGKRPKCQGIAIITPVNPTRQNRLKTHLPCDEGNIEARCVARPALCVCLCVCLCAPCIQEKEEEGVKPMLRKRREKVYFRTRQREQV